MTKNPTEREYYSQDLDKGNKTDAVDWLNNEELHALVSEEHGGIIGYIHKDHIEDIITVLNN